MKKLFENWRKFTEEETPEAETAIATPKGEIPIDKELFDELLRLSAEDPDALSQLISQLQQTQSTTSTEEEALEEWSSLCEGIDLDTGLMSKMGKWARGVGLAAAMAGLSAISAGAAHAGGPPPEQPVATQQVHQDQEQISIGEKAQLLTVYSGVSKVKNPLLKQQIEDAARTGKVNTFKELVDYIKASGGLNSKDMTAFKEAFKKAGDHFHKNPEVRAAKWDNMVNQGIKEE